MKKLLLVLLLFAVSGYAKDRNWQTGKLTTVSIESGSRTPQRMTTWGTMTSYQSHNIVIAVDSGSYRYTAIKQVYAERDFPVLTENESVKFAIEKQQLIVVDERGKEFKARITKRTAL